MYIRPSYLITFKPYCCARDISFGHLTKSAVIYNTVHCITRADKESMVFKPLDIVHVADRSQ